MAKYDYLVVGAGLFGAAFSREMAEKGKTVLIIEKRAHIGGNIYTEKIGDIDVHRYGPHIFHTSNPKIWEYVQQFAVFRPFINRPIANYQGEIYNLPFNMNTFSKLWNIALPEEARKIIENQRLKGKEPENLEEQALSLVGRDVYEKLIKGYTEKQWGRPCSQLSKDIINRLPVRYTYDNNYFDDIWQGIPMEGYTSFVENIIVHKNISVECGVDYLNHREKFAGLASKILYTGGIDGYFSYSLGKLEYRSLSFDTEFLETDNYQGNAVVNFTDREIPYTRIIEHKHFNFQNQKGTVITREYPQPWDIEKEAFYPIANARNEGLYNAYKTLADKEENTLFGGRLGTYTYLNMDKIIEQALQLAYDEYAKES